MNSTANLHPLYTRSYQFRPSTRPLPNVAILGNILFSRGWFFWKDIMTALCRRKLIYHLGGYLVLLSQYPYMQNKRNTLCLVPSNVQS